MRARWFVVGVSVLSALATGVSARQTIRIGAPAPADASDRDVLVMHEIDTRTGQEYGTISAAFVVEARKRLAGLADIAIVAWPRVSLARTAVGGGDDSLAVGEASANALTVLGIRPAAGRDFTDADARSNRRLALLSAGPWQDWFASRSDALGSRLWFRGMKDARPEEVEIVGALPAGALSATPELDIMLGGIVLLGDQFETAAPGMGWPAPFLRLRPGVTLATARRALDLAVAIQRQALVDPVSPSFDVRLETLRSTKR
jgi:hypothetical protein